VRVVRARAGWACAAAVAWAVVSAPAGGAWADPGETNIDLMTRLTSEVVDELYKGFGDRVAGHTLRVKAFATGEDYVFVSNVFTGTLTRAGVAVVVADTRPAGGANPAAGGMPPAGGNPAVTASPAAGANPAGAGNAPSGADPAGATNDPSAPGLVLKFQNIAFDVTYPDVFRSHLIGGKRVRREAAVRILATLSDGASGRVLWTGEAERTSSDVFDAGDTARVEEGTYAFAQPAVPASGWGRYAEPVFVTGIIVGLIYLFFSNQSGN